MLLQFFCFSTFLLLIYFFKRLQINTIALLKEKNIPISSTKVSFYNKITKEYRDCLVEAL